ncbi:hypothetical protein GZ77_17445 [Endozoicomonas montiporae]|uniref:Capsule biosynthesis protein n=2 Tax=Endozoicomonas montiporae TaxID=1027273 RepID=A0A081N1L5_9GAMM|nr:hypothetical protein [Endozoicomonas montiporae]AMO58731.1 capsular polysaccharide transport system permease protein [Endozoicomonas montiporae CL-33]KEQ12338.1 hypothetical protein GZ77_17445 [Endozoicomonas montiporae]
MTKAKEATPIPNRLTIRKEKTKSKKAGLKNNKWYKLARRHLFYRQAGRWFLGFVVIPWTLSAAYYTGIASERYVSEASFMIEKSDSGAGSVEGLSLFGVTPQAGNDQRILEAFIKSPDMMYFLDEQADLRRHYTDKADPLSRLSLDASHERFLQFYRDHIRIRFNDSNGMLDLETQGFTPEFAQNLARLILERSEAFVNEISHSLAAEQLKFVQQEVGLTEQRLKEMTANLVAFQNETGLLSATEQGAALNSIMNELQAELIRSKTELQTLTSYLNENSSQVVALKQRIAALQKQLSAEKIRLTDSETTTLNDLAAQQQELQLDLDLATKAYSSALVALESARTEASRKLKQLVVVSSPHLSEEAKYPRVAYILINILLILLAIYALVRMIRATIREHRD